MKHILFSGTALCLPPSGLDLDLGTSVRAYGFGYTSPTGNSLSQRQSLEKPKIYNTPLLVSRRHNFESKDLLKAIMCHQKTPKLLNISTFKNDKIQKRPSLKVLICIEK